MSNYSSIKPYKEEIGFQLGESSHFKDKFGSYSTIATVTVMLHLLGIFFLMITQIGALGYLKNANFIVKLETSFCTFNLNHIYFGIELESKPTNSIHLQNVNSHISWQSGQHQTNS